MSASTPSDGAETSWAEVCALLLGPSALTAAIWAAGPLSFTEYARVAFVPGMLVEYLFALALLLVLRHRGAGMASVGWRGRRPGDLVVGIGTGIALFLAFGLVAAGLAKVLPAVDFRGPRPAWATWVYGFGVLTAFAPVEELLWRGYALSRLKTLGLGMPAAVTLSSTAFASLHWWGGLALVVSTGLAGVAYCAVYLRRRSLLAVIVAHFVADLPLFLFMLLGVRPPS